MYKLFIVLLAVFLCGADLDAQQMRWVPGHEVADPSYVDGTNCKENILCYSLAYTPAESGVLTSYTTNFLVDCDGGNSAVVSNVSLIMTDNSDQQSACAEAGKLLMHSSGNSGAIKVKANREIYLHEICIQTSGKQTTLEFAADEVGGMTTSLDRNDQPAVTERPLFRNFRFKRNFAACEDTPAEVFAVPETGLATDLDGQRDGLRLTIAPNPVSDRLMVRFDHTATTADFRLLDASGKELRKWAAPTGATTPVNVSDLPAGLYYLNARTAQEELTEKFVVQR